MLQIDCISTLDELQQYRNAWDRLSQSVLTSPEWLWNWWQAYGDEHTLYVLRLQDAGRTVGFAPFYRETTRSGALAIKFLGSGKVCTDYQTILVEDGYQEMASVGIAEWLVQACNDDLLYWDRLEFESSADGDAAVEGLLNAFEQLDVQHAAKSADGGWAFDFGETWDGYFGRVKKNVRQKLRKLVKTYVDTGRSRLVEAKQGEDTSAWFDRLVELHQARWAAVGIDGCFSTSEFTSFLRTAVSELHDEGRAWLVGLELDGELVGVAFYLVDGDVIRLYQIGVCPNRRADQIGWQLHLLVLQAAFERGIQRVDFLRGQEDYKRYLGGELVPQTAYRVVAPRSSSKLRHQLWVTKDWLRDWGKNLTSS